MRLFNTLSGEKETFSPTADPVTLYVCGVTPYDTTHLGHARTYLIFDVLQRYLAYLGMRVHYVQNVTDVDDPLLAKARELDVDYMDLGRRYVEIFVADLLTLNVLLPAAHPRVTEEIPGIIEAIRVLVAREVAYAAGGSVYFRARRFPGFGAMSRMDRSGMLAAQRGIGEDPDDGNKEDPLDFRLWLAAQPGEPIWESPWGPGRPGWHIECSTIASRYLGNRIDIHGGGADLIFPHHCCEIAQSESVSGESPFSRFWVHAGLVWMGGEKMSKSLGNMAFVRDLVPVYGGNALRHYLLDHPYRDRFDYVEARLAQTADSWSRIADAATGPVNEDGSPAGQVLFQEILGALDDDLDTQAALAGVDQLAALVRRDARPGDRALLRSLLDVLGFRLDSPVMP